MKTLRTLNAPPSGVERGQGGTKAGGGGALILMADAVACAKLRQEGVSGYSQQPVSYAQTKDSLAEQGVQ